MQLEATLGDTKFNWLFLEDVEGRLELTEDPLCSYRQFLKITSGESFQLVPQRYSKMAESFVSSSYVAAALMPKSDLKSGLKKAENLLRQSVSSIADQHYLTHWSKIHQFLESLQPARVDIVALENLIRERDAEGSRNLLSFKPDASGFARRVRYNVSDTTTG